MSISKSLHGLFWLLFMAGNASATVIVTGYNADDGTEIFVPKSTVISFELADIFDTLAMPTGLSFGFYFAADSGTLIEIFDPLDVGSAGTAIAQLDFGLGRVVDVDENAVQSTFAAGLAPIGFYLVSPVGTLYTQSALNPVGLPDPDAAQTLAQIGNPDIYVIGFEVLDTILALEVINGVTPVAAPSTVSLLILGLLLAGRRGVTGRARRFRHAPAGQII
jgi:hypothetical protein